MCTNETGLKLFKILFVDDDETLLLLAEKSLKRMGFKPVTVNGGEEAQRILETENFDLVITDLYMEKGGGQQLIDWCLENRKDTKLMAISGEDLNVTLSALEIVADKGIPTMEKPFKMDNLEAIINGLMSNQFH